MTPMLSRIRNHALGFAPGLSILLMADDWDISRQVVVLQSFAA